MKFGYVKIATYTPEIKIGQTDYNANCVKEGIKSAYTQGVEVLVMPELTLTGYTVADLLYTDLLTVGALNGLKEIIEFSLGYKMLVFVGLPVKERGKLYDACAVVCNGKLLAIIPKTYLDDDGGKYESRYFTAFDGVNGSITICGQTVPFGNKIILTDNVNPEACLGVEISTDANAVITPSAEHVCAGANLVVNLGACEEIYSQTQTLEAEVNALSKKLGVAYAYANAGVGESTTDSVYSGRSIICERGVTLAQSQPFNQNLTIAEVDLSYLAFKRSKDVKTPQVDGYLNIEVDFVGDGLPSIRKYAKTPFVPTDSKGLIDCASSTISIQAQGLASRITRSYSKKAVLGLSGGLDSTLAIIVAVNAMKLLGRPASDVLAITMPCFGTTGRTLNNSVKLAKALGATIKKIDIGKAATRHLKDIRHDGSLDVTYENAQARERTQVLMDVANGCGGLVVGTGDLSEVALGWATYNGDHMSMYGVNCTVPKTLVRHLVGYYASISRGKLKAVLNDILDTPVSPELLPAENGTISQITEDIVGPYILHDFFLYNFIERGFSPEKIYYIACQTFDGDFKSETILKWLKIFFKRFFAQQFKRSCVPDGVKVGEISLSPRGSWHMPSDCSADLWLNQLECL